MNKNKKIKVSVLRILAFSLILCLLTALVFGFSEALFERLSRNVDQESDNTKNTRWVLGHLENLLLFPVLAISGLLYGKREDVSLTLVHHKEKKISFVILFIFTFFVFLPYYVTQNTFGDMSAFAVLGDKTMWFATQVIILSSLIMYHSAREAHFVALLEEKGE